LATFPSIGKREAFAIGGDGISFLVSREVLLRFAHDAGRIFFEGVGGVAIDRSSVALEFNVGRNRDGLPIGVVEVGFEEIQRAFPGMIDPMEFPLAVQKLAPRRFKALFFKGILLGGEGHLDCVCGKLVDPKDRLVFPVGRSNGPGDQEKKKDTNSQVHVVSLANR